MHGTILGCMVLCTLVEGIEVEPEGMLYVALSIPCRKALNLRREALGRPICGGKIECGLKAQVFPFKLINLGYGEHGAGWLFIDCIGWAKLLGAQFVEGRLNYVE